MPDVEARWPSAENVAMVGTFDIEEVDDDDE